MKYELTNFCEIDAEAIKSYCAIHEAETDKNLGDIELVDETKLKPFTFMVGGTPCQDFSVSGTRRGAVWHCNLCGEEYNPLTVKSDKRRFCPLCDGKDISKTRSSLLVEWLRILEYIKPDVAIYENVKNILSLSFREMFDLFVEELKESEYNVYWEGLNAKDFGIPQNRERLYMVIVKKELDNGKFKFPDRYLYEAQIGDFLLENAADTFYESHIKGVFIDKRIKPSVRKVYEEDLEEVIDCKKAMYQCKCKSGFQDCKIGIKLAPTLRAGNPHTAVLHSNHIRRLYPVENVRLMGFDNTDYERMRAAGVSDTQIYKQTGNSIVVPKIDSAEMMFSAGRSRRISIVAIIQSLAQLEKNYGKEGSSIIIDNCQLTVFGGFAPNSETAEVMSKNLGEQTILSGSVTQSKNDGSKSLQMMSRSLMTVDELKTMPRFHFIIAKTGVNPMRTKLDLFFKWGIELNKEYENKKHEVRKVSYAGKDELIAEIERIEKIIPKEEKDDKNAPGGGMGITQKAVENSHKKIGRGARVDGCEQDHNKIN